MYAKRPAAQARPTRSNKSMTGSLNVTRDGSVSGPQGFTTTYPRGVPKCIANDFNLLENPTQGSSLQNAIHRCKTHENGPLLPLQNRDVKTSKALFTARKPFHRHTASASKTPFAGWIAKRNASRNKGVPPAPLSLRCREPFVKDFRATFSARRAMHVPAGCSRLKSTGWEAQSPGLHLS